MANENLVGESDFIITDLLGHEMNRNQQLLPNVIQNVGLNTDDSIVELFSRNCHDESHKSLGSEKAMHDQQPKKFQAQS